MSQTLPRPDARTRRTCQALSVALVDLMRTRDFDAITVQDLLDRAGVGRATFYSHFRNKDDFLFSDYERMLGAVEAHFDRVAGGTRRLAPVAELFSHLRDAAEFARAIERSGRLEGMYDIASGHLARIIERRLLVLDAQPRNLPLAAASRVLGAMAMELGKWWLARDAVFSASELDVRFHELAWQGVGGR